MIETIAAREPWLAAVLSTMIPGAGQAYAGKKGNGAVIFAITLAAWCAVYYSILGSRGGIAAAAAFVLAPFSLAFYVWNIFNAFRITRKQNPAQFEETRTSSKDAWLAVFLNRFILPGTGNIYLGRKAEGILILVGFFAILIVLEIFSRKLDQFFRDLISLAFVVSVVYLSYSAAPHREKSMKLMHLVIIVSLLLDPRIVSFILPLKAYYMPTGSMENTFRIGDHVLVRMADRYTPRRGDILIHSVPHIEKLYIKRCIAVAGDSFRIRGGAVYLNGKKLDEPYAKGKTTYDNFIVRDSNRIDGIVPEGKIIVLGDNRQNSQDSRYFGYLSIERAKGSVAAIYWNSTEFLGGNFSRFGRVE